MGYLTRKPTSNEPPKKGKSPYGGGEIIDDFHLLLNGDGRYCKKCQRVTRNEHLDENDLCPDCRR